MVKKNPKYELQRRQHKHEEKMALLDIFKQDPEMKYFMGAMLGSSAGLITAMSTGKIVETQESKDIWDQVGEGIKTGVLLGSPLGFLADKALNQDTGMFGFIPGVLGMMGTSFSGFCMGVLILKAILSSLMHDI